VFVTEAAVFEGQISKLHWLQDTGAGLKLLGTFAGFGVNFSYSSAGGLAARNDKVFVVSKNFPADDTIVMWRLSPQPGLFADFLVLFTASGGFLSGLAVVE
jgi:hypothetical protein